MNDRQRKDRLIQTRVPQNLESTLKDEARKRRLSVSHLIRNVLEDTFNLVDNVVVEVDRVVTDSVEMAATLKRDAQRLAATARGETAHRSDSSRPPGARSAEGTNGEAAEDEADAAEADATPESVPSALAEESHGDSAPPPAEPAIASEAPVRDPAVVAERLSSAYAFQELVVNRPAECAGCGVVIGRGSRAFLALTETLGPSRTWACADCVESIGGQGE